MSRLDNFDEILNSYEGRKVEIVSPFSFNGLEWQPRAYREPNEIRDLWKAMFCFDDSQKKLVQAGYERHPLSAEAFSLIIAHLEGKLSPELDEVAEDLLAGPGEFFCQAIETVRVSNTDRFIAKIYENNSATRRFDITALKLGECNYYKDIYDTYSEHNDLIEYLTSRKYEDLPDEIKENGVIGLPNPGDVLPIGRSGFNIKYGIDGLGPNRASRGVRPAKVK